MLHSRAIFHAIPTTPAPVGARPRPALLLVATRSRGRDTRGSVAWASRPRWETRAPPRPLGGRASSRAVRARPRYAQRRPGPLNPSPSPRPSHQGREKKSVVSLDGPASRMGASAGRTTRHRPLATSPSPGTGSHRGAGRSRRSPSLVPFLWTWEWSGNHCIALPRQGL